MAVQGFVDTFTRLAYNKGKDKLWRWIPNGQDEILALQGGKRYLISYGNRGRFAKFSPYKNEKGWFNGFDGQPLMYYKRMPDLECITPAMVKFFNKNKQLDHDKKEKEERVTNNNINCVYTNMGFTSEPRRAVEEWDYNDKKGSGDRRIGNWRLFLRQYRETLGCYWVCWTPESGASKAALASARKSNKIDEINRKINELKSEIVGLENQLSVINL